MAGDHPLVACFCPGISFRKQVHSPAGPCDNELSSSMEQANPRKRGRMHHKATTTPAWPLHFAWPASYNYAESWRM